MQSGFLITICCGSSPRIVEVVKFPNSSENSELNYDDFVYSVLLDSGITFYEFDGFTNFKGTPVPENIFTKYAKQYYMHPDFYLNIKTKSYVDLDNFSTNVREPEVSKVDEISTPGVHIATSVKRTYACVGPSLILTSEGLKAFILKKAGGAEIISGHEAVGVLSNKARRTIISIIACYIEKSFGDKPTHEVQIAAAKACVALFPCLQSADELLVNNKNSGFLQIKLKNNRVKRRKLENEFGKSNASLDVNLDESDNEVDLSEIKKNLDELQSFTYPEQVELAKEKLKYTLKYRRQLVKSETKFSVFECCKYFFICPELISFDFSLTYTLASQKYLNVIWKLYQSHVFTVVKNEGKKLLYTELDRELDWDTVILSVINLLRLLPPAAIGPKKSSRLTNEQAIGRIIQFKKRNLTNAEYLEGSTARAPYILAVGDSKGSILQYMVVLDSHLIPLSSSVKFLDALDVVFKLHFILNIKYDINLRIFWSFFEKYLYKMECSVTSVVKDVYLKFQRVQNLQ